MTTPTNQPADPSTAASALTPDQLSGMRTLKRQHSQEIREIADDTLVKRMRLEKGPAATASDKTEEATSVLQWSPPAVKKAKTSPPEGSYDFY